MQFTNIYLYKSSEILFFQKKVKKVETPQKRLEEWINDHFATKAEFCRKLGIDTTLLSRYIGEGKKSIFGNKFRNKLLSMGLNYDWYKTGDGLPNLDVNDNRRLTGEYFVKEPSNVYETTLPDGMYVRFVTVPANAGKGYNFDDEAEMLINIQRKYGPKTHIAMKVKGDSMSPEITDNSTIIIDTTREPKTNNIVLAMVDGVMYCKRYVVEGDKKYLKSDNINFETFLINGVNHVEIKGVVVEAYKKWA